MKLYVAGPSKEILRVRGCMHFAKVYAGCTITHDWTVLVEDAFQRHRSLEEIPLADRQALRAGDLLGIETADVVWFLAPSRENVTRDGWMEAWHALTRGKRVLVTGDQAFDSLFLCDAHLRDRFDTAGLHQLVEWHSERQASARAGAVEVRP